MSTTSMNLHLAEGDAPLRVTRYHDTPVDPFTTITIGQPGASVKIFGTDDELRDWWVKQTALVLAALEPKPAADDDPPGYGHQAWSPEDEDIAEALGLIEAGEE